MNYTKIQQQLLKKWANPRGDYIWGKYDGKIAVGTQAHLVFIPDKEFLLDATKAAKPPMSDRGIESLFKAAHMSNFKTWIKTGIMHREGKFMMCEFKDDKDNYKFCDEKLLKRFDAGYCLYKSTSSYDTPIFIYEDESMVGLIMPIKTDTRPNRK